MYFVQSEKDQVKRFELLREALKLKKNTTEIKEAISQMLEEISDREKVELVANKYPIHFSSSAISWQMEYDIANKIPAKERQNDNLTYVLELTNYCFYYLLLPLNFRNTFFLLHGMAAGDDIKKWEKLTNKMKSRYIIYKSSQELLSSYVVEGKNLNREDLGLIERLYAFYNIDASANTAADDNGIYFLQISDRKR